MSYVFMCIYLDEVHGLKCFGLYFGTVHYTYTTFMRKLSYFNKYKKILL